MLLRVVGPVCIALILSCGGGSSGGGGGDESPSDPSTTEVTATTEEDGAITAAISANATDIQLLRASAGSAIDGASVAFPPGALAIDTNVTVEEGVSLASANLAADLGLAEAVLSAAGPAVVVAANPPTNAIKPFTVTLFATSTLRLTALENLVVSYKIFDADTGTYLIGVIPLAELTINGNVVTFSTTLFGAFQAMFSSKTIEARVEKETSEVIVTVRDTKKNPTPTADTTPPTLVGQAPNAGVVQLMAPLSFKFNEGMSITGATVTGTMLGAQQTATVTLAKATVADDTVVITPPAAGWALGNGKTLAIAVKDKAGNAATPVSLVKDVVAKVYYVRENGSDTATGTAAAPFKTIRKAIDQGMTDNVSHYIFVAAGTYVQNLMVHEKTRLLGGFSATSWDVRDHKAHITTIQGNSSSEVAPYQSTIEFATYDPQNPVAAESVVDGFTIKTPTTWSVWYMIKMSDAASIVRLENNVMDMPMPVSMPMAGWAIDGSGVELTLIGNDIKMGNIAQEAGAIRLYGPSGLVIARNSIVSANIDNTSGYPGDTKAIRITAPSEAISEPFRIHDNVIVAGMSGSTQGDGDSIAIDISSYDAEIRNNTIISKGAEATSIGIRISGGQFNIDNNIIRTSSSSSEYCVNSTATSIASLYSNDFVGCDDGADGEAIVGHGSASVTDVADINDTVLLDVAAAGGNIATDPLFSNATNNDYRLGATSPAKGKGKNGKTAGWNFGGTYFDLGGTNRGNTWSIGAFQ